MIYSIMTLPKLTDFDLQNKKVLVRADLDFDPADTKNLRLVTLYETLDYLKSQNASLTLIGHRGRPDGKVDESLSMMPFKSLFQNYNLNILENLRFKVGEENNDENFAKSLANNQDFFVNE